MDENFLLETTTAQDLFHNHAAKMPIIDYHCHLIPEMVANDHKFKALQSCGLAETIINGVQCVLTAFLKNTVQEQKPVTGRSLKMG